MVARISSPRRSSHGARQRSATAATSRDRT